MNGENHLKISLEAAVPLWINRFEEQPWEKVCQAISEKSKTLPNILGHRGEILIFGGGKPGEAADLFNQTAEAIALMSFLPGGIHIFENHWETKHGGNPNEK